jgi:hypothetical protein
VTGSVYYLNADFDLGLRARPWALLRPSMRKAVRAMSVHGLLLGRAGDAVLTRAGIPDDFLRYLEGLGVAPPRLLRHPEIDRGMSFRPFGWSGEAIELNRGQAEPSLHPSLDLLRTVNSRGFSAALEREHFDGEDAGREFSSVADLDRWLAKEGERAGGWVVKADHGNSGVGNRRLRRRELSSEDRIFIASLLEEDDLVVVEPWRERVADLCAVFALERGGAMGPVRLHETVYTRDGALIGAVFQDGYGGVWRTSLERAAGIIAGELTERGYFGPVCFDAFVYREGGGEQLRPLADLNCRRPMSDAVSRFWREKMPESVLFWRFFATRKLKPRTVGAVVSAADHFDPGRKRGVLLTSPWEIELDDGPVRAPRLAVAFVGEDRAGVQALETSFRKRYER